jgi:ParB family transcriptional regulator, chromosome partitioning protein
MNTLQKKRLGRGLAALIGDDLVETPVNPVSSQSENLVPPGSVVGLRYLAIDLLKANPNNPRRHFAVEDIASLAASLRDKGVLQPIMVRPKADGFEIVAGERRWRAAQQAGIHQVPVIIRDLDDRETLEIAIIENVQRSDLNPLEEARAYKMLMDQYDYTQQQLAESIGKSRSHIANTLRLMQLPASVLTHIETGALSAGHARAIVATENPNDLAERIIKLGLSVRQAEDLTREQAAASKKSVPKDKDADTRALEQTLSASLGLAVNIDHKNRGGHVTISYKTLEQLELVAQRLSQAH